VRRLDLLPGLVAAGLALAAGLWAAPVGAQEDEPAAEVPVNLLVVHTSDAEGGIDPRARELDRKLSKQIRYKSMRVVGEERVRLRTGEVHTLALPDGRSARLQLMHKGEQGVLVAVDVERAVKTDVRARNHHTVVIGAGEYRDGHLAISLEPDY